MSKPFTLKTARPMTSWWHGTGANARPHSFDSYEEAYREGRNYGGDFVVLENGRPILRYKDGYRSWVRASARSQYLKRRTHRAKGRHR